MPKGKLTSHAKEHGLLHELLRLQFRIATEEDIVHWGVKASPMSPADFSTLWGAAVDSPSKEAYISDAALSLLWGDIGNDDPIPTERLAFLDNLWNTAHMAFASFADAAGISIGDLCRTMGIDYHTNRDWQSNLKAIPEYARIMMARTLHLIPGTSCNTHNEELSPAVFWNFWANAVDTPNKEHYVAENGVTLLWPIGEDFSDASAFQEVPAQRFAILWNIWDAAPETFDMFANRAGMSIADLCRTMGIDYETSQVWLADSKAIPEYARVMLARSIGMF